MPKQIQVKNHMCQFDSEEYFSSVVLSYNVLSYKLMRYTHLTQRSPVKCFLGANENHGYGDGMMETLFRGRDTFRGEAKDKHRLQKHL